MLAWACLGVCEQCAHVCAEKKRITFCALVHGCGVCVCICCLLAALKSVWHCQQRNPHEVVFAF